MTIEQRIAELQSHATDIALMAEKELVRRIVFTTRARVMISVTGDTLKAMDRLEGEAVASDFDHEWHELKIKLSESRKQFQQILNGAADITQPACYPATGRGNR